jgi:hypothetical protein
VNAEPMAATPGTALAMQVLAKAWGVSRQQGQSMEGWLKELENRMALAWPENEEAGRVLTALYGALWSWTSESHHYRSKVPLHREAAFAVALTGDLLTHAGHLLQAHPEPLKAPRVGVHTTNGPAPAEKKPAST